MRLSNHWMLLAAGLMLGGCNADQPAVTSAPASPEAVAPDAAAPVTAAASDAAVEADAQQGDRSPVGNARFSGVEMLYPHSGCSFEASPVDFCDEAHRAQIEQAIQSKPANFNDHYLVAQLEERKEYFQRSVVVIDSNTGKVYPLPIDAFSGPLAKGVDATDYGKVDTALDKEQFCVEGAILVYRAFEEGKFCFGFDGRKFTGHQTTYMSEY